MKTAFTFYDIFVNKITKLVGLVAGVMLFVPAFMVFYEVLARGIFNAPTEWVMEISTYCVVMAGFLGMGVTYSFGRHIKVDLLLTQLSPKVKCYLEVITSIVGIFFVYLFFTESLDMALLSLKNNNCAPTTLSTPLWIPQMALPVGMGVLLLQLIRTLILDLTKVATGNYSKGAN